MLNLNQMMTQFSQEASALMSQASKKAGEMYDKTAQGAEGLIDKASNQAGELVDKASQLAGNEESQQAFIDQFDQNNDGKITAAEVKKQLDQNKDGFVSAQEIEKMVIKGQASELDKTTLKVLTSAAATAQASVVLFNESEGVWNESDKMGSLREQDTKTVPFNGKSLDSRDLNEVKKAKEGVFQVQTQKGNSCGTTSLSMYMKYFQGHTLENSVPTIDNYIRANGDLEIALPTGDIKSFKLDGYTAPREIVSYAKTHGMRAGLQNNASISSLKAKLDQGVPCLCLTDWNFKSYSSTRPTGGDPDANSLHWVNVIGYEKNASGETDFIIANPHGKIQRVSEDDFNKIWTGSGPGLEQEIPKVGNINTGVKRLFVAMVPQDDDYQVIAPNGTSRSAGDISIPSGSDGIRGKLGKWGSDAMKFAANSQENVAKRTVQLADETLKGYAQDGVWGAITNLWEGDVSQASKIKASAMKSPLPQRAKIINKLLEKGINREYIQDTVYEILRETDWGDFGDLIADIDMRKLASRLKNDNQAGRVMAWVAKAEVKANGKTGPKFEAFAKYMTYEHREDAVLKFLDNKYTKDDKLFHKVPAGVARNMIKDLMNGQTDGGEETTIYRMLQDASWGQFDQIMSRLDMNQVASELEGTSELGNLLAWSIENGMKTGHWGNVSEILSHLEGTMEYTNADDVVGHAIIRGSLKGKTSQIPSHLRKRMRTLVDDITRVRSNKAVQANKLLK